METPTEFVPQIVTEIALIDLSGFGIIQCKYSTIFTIFHLMGIPFDLKN